MGSTTTVESREANRLLSSRLGAEELAAFNEFNAALTGLEANYWASYGKLCCDAFEYGYGPCPQTLNGVLVALGESVSIWPEIGLAEIEEILGFLARCESLGFRYDVVGGMVSLCRPEFDSPCYECLYVSQAMAFLSGWALQRLALGVDDAIVSSIRLCGCVLPLPADIRFGGES